MFALIIALASGGYIALAWVQQEFEIIPLSLVGASAVVLLIGAALPTARRGWRWILVTASTMAWVLVLGALALQFNEQKPLAVRAVLVALLMFGLLLNQRTVFLARKRPRHGFHNYYDAHR